jgi:dTDP-4-amino-4,6-dideoxygalactose transaminase
VLVEPDIDTFNLDLSEIESKITSKTKAIMLVHLYGRICWNEEVKELAKKYNLLIIEDNAQAIGARWKNDVKSGTLGDAAGLSFYPGKNLGALGDSGAVSTDDDALGLIIRSLANYGSQTKYINDYKGLNSRMDEIQAAFLRIKLKYLDSENIQRRKIASFYLKEIVNEKIILPVIEGMLPESHVWHLFVIRSKRRDDLQRYLSGEGIQTLIHYPVPPHKQKCYSEMNGLSFPVTEQIADEALSLPISPVMEFNEIERIVECINKF